MSGKADRRGEDAAGPTIDFAAVDGHLVETLDELERL